MPRESTAARLARQPLDKYGRPLQVSRSSGSPYMGDLNGGNIGVGAEIYLGDIGWVDISSDIYYRDGSTKVTISRGRPDENSQSIPPPQTCSFQLNNRSNQYSPRNPVGPLFGLIGRNTPVRFWRMQNGQRRYRYYGEIPEWPTTADISGNDVYTSVQASGMLRRLQQGSKLTGSSLRRDMLSKSRDNGISSRIFDYWPMEDGSNATQFASGISGRNPMFVTNSGITFASNSSYPASDALPVFTTGSVSGAVSSYMDTSVIALRWYMSVPSGGVTGTQHAISLSGNGSINKFSVMVKSDGTMWLLGYDVTGTEVTGNIPIAFTANGHNMICGLDLVKSGSNINWNLYSFTVDSLTTVNPFTQIIQFQSFQGTINSQSIGVISTVSVGEDKGLNSTVIGHVSIANDTTAYTFTGPGMYANNEEIPQNRIARLFQEQSINFTGISSPLDEPYTVSMGLQLSDKLINLVQQCVDTDGGVFYEGADRLGFLHRDIGTLYNQSAKLKLDYAQNQISAQLAPRDDDLYTKNDVTAQRINGSSNRQVLSSGRLSVNDPPSGAGTYDTTVNVSIGTDAQAADQAGWRLHMGTVDEPRYNNVSINLRHPTFQNKLDMMNAALSVDIGDVIEIDNPPAWISYDPIRLVVLGYQETMGAFEHDITFNCAPESSYRVAVLDDPVLSRADTDGSQLSAAMSTLLNTDGQFATGVSSWTPTSCAVSQVGTMGSSNPLPSGGPTGYGAMLTANGGSSVQISQNLMSFPVVAGQTYNISALVYYPSAAHTVMLGIAWRSANNTFISSSTTFTAVTANTWTPISLSFTAVSTAVLANPLVGLGGTPANGDILYVTDIAMWQGDVLVATEDPTKPLWTTSSSDFPFDIGVGGERMTVTGISGSSSPQTFTVARSVNGVIKPQTVGTDVRLWQPAILSM